MKITYRQIYDEALHHEITQAQYKGVIMELEEGDDLVFIWGMDSANKGQGECQEMIDLLREEFKGKRLCASPPVNKASKHILDKKGVEYKEFMK